MYDVKENSRLQLLLPMRLLHGNYYYVKQTVVPKILNKKLYALQFVNIPIKLYEVESYKLEVLTGTQVDKIKTSYIKDRMEPDGFFSMEQIKTTELIYQGFTSGEIAAKLNKTRAAYKLNRKILEKISDFFEMEFDNVCQAVSFYGHCFNHYFYTVVP